MVEIKVDRSIGRIILKTDDSTVKYLLESTTKENKYIPWKRAWGTVTTVNKIYDNTRVKPDSKGIWTFILGLGWAAYLINVFRASISQEDYEGVLRDAIYSETYRTIPFTELRDYQNEDVLHLLKYRTGLLSCYTSYGKLKNIHYEKSN